MLTLFTAGPRITTVPRHCGGSECGKWSSGAAYCADCANLGILISGQHLADVRCLVSSIQYPGLHTLSRYSASAFSLTAVYCHYINSLHHQQSPDE